MRNIVKKCFTAFVDEIDIECINNLVDVISRKNEEFI